MSTWNAGYVSDIPYTFGCYPELNPLRITLPFLRAGIKPPIIRTACELGIGQGVSTNIHAAASGVEWHGNDFNPSHAVFAAGLAAAAGSKTHIYDDSFEDFAARDDLPQFDFIGVHGVWSWISDANRAHIVRFIQKHLRVGGVLYMSYNTLPGWTYFLPIRQMIWDYADQLQGSGIDSVTRVGAAMSFVEKYLAADPILARQIPTLQEKFKAISALNPRYLAHEYFNRDWRPMYFREISDGLSAAKVEFAGSAHYPDYVDALNLTDAQLALIQQQPNWQWRETMRDFVTCQQFRRDYWIKGAERLTALEQQTALREHRIVLTAPADKISLKVATTRGEGTLNAEVYKPVIDLMADLKPRSLGEIEKSLKGLNFAQISEAAVVLCGFGHASPVTEQEVMEAAMEPTRRLNQRFAELARNAPEISVMASPMIGGSIPVDRFEQMFVEGIWHGKKDAASLADHAFAYLNAQTQRIVKDGKPLMSDEENREELLARAETFLTSRLALLQSLRIC